ncbi:MAG: beta-hydroxyacyl-ACP dehydratase [Planctomycetaceae bacterium]|nr:MAG: beta-hydroxyacyl-ACP dehydratase [Planctomycetaceae bacterium]
MRFYLIDRVLELTPERSITAIKNLTLAEEYLADHFPGFPVLPGVLMLETMVQAGAWLIKVSREFEPSLVLLREAKALKFNSFVSPGKTLMVQLQVKKQQDRIWELQGTGTIDGSSAVSARLSLEAFNLAERNPELASSDQRRRDAARELWNQIRPRDPTASSTS